MQTRADKRKNQNEGKVPDAIIAGFEIFQLLNETRKTTSLNKKSEHDYWILHIRIGLGTKFYFKLIILIFWTKFAQKGYFRSKTETVIITIEFWIFELHEVIKYNF